MKQLQPRRCHDPRSATLNISVSRAVPITQQNGNAPLADDIQEANRVAALDAWVLMESVNLLDTWGDEGLSRSWSYCHSRWQPA
jgi:hypothetical protein